MCYTLFIVNNNKVMIGIYKITNKANNKMYVGKSKNIKKRWYQHRYKLTRGISSCKYLQNAWNKYGEENFNFDIIAEGNFSKEELKQLEEIFIKLYGHYNILTISHIHKFSKERKQNQSKKMKEVWQNPEYKKKRAEESKARWADLKWREKQIASITSDAWDLYPQVIEFWRNKSNGRGGCNNPGTVEIQSKFNLPRSIVDRMLIQIKQDESIQVIEAYNKEEIYKFWLDSNNAGQAKYNHPGKRIISKQFNISDAQAQELIREFKQSTNSTTIKSYDKNKIYKDWKDNNITYKDIMNKYNLGRTKSFNLIREFKQE